MDRISSSRRLAIELSNLRMMRLSSDTTTNANGLMVFRRFARGIQVAVVAVDELSSNGSVNVSVEVNVKVKVKVKKR